MKILIDPIVNIFYGAFYVKGLYDIFGKNNVKFSAKPFEKLSITSRMFGFSFVIDNQQYQRKYVISFEDSYKVIDELYEWCDVYGSVNANFSKTPEKYHDKLVSLPPSFGIRIWSLYKTIYYAVTNLIKSKISSKGGFNIKKFLGKYKKMYLLRVPLSNYKTDNNITPDNNYVFHLSTLWYNDEWNKNDEGVNKTRANFIRACKNVEKCCFDGGFVSQGSSRSSEELFKDCLSDSMVDFQTWLRKTKKSTFVFNTPAFWNCHGWKLGEYLALGKAIISTKISNDLPSPLQHGVNIHFVENTEEDMREAVQKLLKDKEYCQKLEKGAKEYWEKYGTPLQSLYLLGLKKT